MWTQAPPAVARVSGLPFPPLTLCSCPCVWGWGGGRALHMWQGESLTAQARRNPGCLQLGNLGYLCCTLREREEVRLLPWWGRPQGLWWLQHTAPASVARVLCCSLSSRRWTVQLSGRATVPSATSHLIIQVLSWLISISITSFSLTHFALQRLCSAHLWRAGVQHFSNVWRFSNVCPLSSFSSTFIFAHGNYSLVWFSLLCFHWGLGGQDLVHSIFPSS